MSHGYTLKTAFTAYSEEIGIAKLAACHFRAHAGVLVQICVDVIVDSVKPDFKSAAKTGCESRVAVAFLTSEMKVSVDGLHMKADVWRDTDACAEKRDAVGPSANGRQDAFHSGSAECRSYDIFDFSYWVFIFHHEVGTQTHGPYVPAALF